jgi:hypothetical protein
MRASLKLWMLLALVTVSFALSAAPVSADPITEPTGLNVGDQYRLAFVTSTTSVATSTVSARTNTATDPTPPGDTGVPIYLVNDTKLVDHYDDLWDGNIDIPFNINENADAVTSFVFTGSSHTGLQEVPARPLGFNGPEGTSWIGETRFPTITWMVGGTSSDLTATFPFYAMSGVLTVVPEPGSFILMSIGGRGWANRLRPTTAMDISSDGSRAVVLTYGHAYEYAASTAKRGQSRFAAHPEKSRCHPALKARRFVTARTGQLCF